MSWKVELLGQRCPHKFSLAMMPSLWGGDSMDEPMLIVNLATAAAGILTCTLTVVLVMVALQTKRSQ